MRSSTLLLGLALAVCSVLSSSEALWGIDKTFYYKSQPHQTGPTEPNRQQRYTPARNFPGMAKFPPMKAFKQLAVDVGVERVLFPNSEGYREAILRHNNRTIRYPFAVVYVENVQHIQTVLRFARQHNVMITVQSSGHSYIGRSVYDGSIQINLGKMKGRTVNLNSDRNEAGEITVESGNTWLEVYREVDSYGRVVVGGSAHTVAMGGYTQGGGHSPIGRALGLAVDNLLEATLVLVDGRVVTVSDKGQRVQELDGTVTENCDPSLFWAIRGGGGGTWGVVVTFTFKLHYPPTRVRTVGASWILKEFDDDSFGRETVKHVMEQLTYLCPQWGGYILTSPDEVPNTPYSYFLSIYMNHFGSDSDPCNSQIDAILNYNVSGNQFRRDDVTHPTFLSYELTARDPKFTNLYLVSTFVQPEYLREKTSQDTFADIILSAGTYRSGCVATLVGGNMNLVKDGETPVNPAFRSGILSMTCTVSWDLSVPDPTVFVDLALEYSQRIQRVGRGVYFNEPDEDLEDWKTQFWGSTNTYCKLATIKRKVDPDNFLWCHNCVGSDFRYDCPLAYVYRQAFISKVCSAIGRF